MSQEQTIQTIESGEQVDDIIESNVRAVINFWAPWAQPCIQMNTVFETLFKVTKKDNDSADQEGKPFIFATAIAEKYPELMSKLNISTVPTFLLLFEKRIVRRIDGADAPFLSASVDWLMKSSSEQLLQGACESITRLDEITLVMKGDPSSPKCGFCKQVVHILRTNGVHFAHYDVLQDEEVREAMKRYSKWPTYPQLYARGRLIGGVDAVSKLADEGALIKELGRDGGETTDGDATDTRTGESGASVGATKHGGRADALDQTLRDRLDMLVQQHAVMVFMKGVPDEPRCGFSRKIVATLREQQVRFGSFDILQDMEVRQGLKVYSEWPTFPQVYANGKFVGGLDIVQDLVEMDALKDELGLVATV